MRENSRKKMKLFVMLVLVMLLVGCAAVTQHRNVCNAIYCNPDVIGKSTHDIRALFGEPALIEREGDHYVWSYDVKSLWRFGSQGTLKVTFKDGVATGSKFYPPNYQETSRFVEDKGA